jgi:hypothetical protein
MHINSKNLTIGAITLVSMVTIFSHVKSPDVCSQAFGQDFHSDFRHMTSTAEHCSGNQFNCEARLPHWEKPIVVNVLNANAEPSKVEQIRSITFRALAEISKYAPIQVANETDLEPNFMVFIMNEKMLDYLSKRGASSLDFTENSLHRRAYNDQSCSARLWMSRLSEIPSSEYQVAEAGAIFIHHRLQGLELQSCIYEEIAGILGLSNDPEGQPSLFSRGNYEISNGQFTYSRKILVMFQAIYEIASGNFADIDSFCKDQDILVDPGLSSQSSR